MKKRVNLIIALLLAALFMLTSVFPLGFGEQGTQAVYAAEKTADNSRDMAANVTGEDEQISITDAEIELGRTQYVYSGTAKKPSVEVYMDEYLQQDVDYTVSYQNNINAGRATVVITGIGDYTDQTTRTFRITRKTISKNKVTIPAKKYLYTGNKIKPKVTVKNGQKKLVKGKDYTVRYKKNKRIGTARVIVKGKGNYKGTITKKYRIKKYFKLYKSQYSKFIQGKVTNGQLAKILFNVMWYNSSRQNITKKKISRSVRLNKNNFDALQIRMFNGLNSFWYGSDDYGNYVGSFKIKEANQKLSAFTSFRYKPYRDYYYQEYKKVYTDDERVYIETQDMGYDNWVKIISAKRYARKIEVVFRFGGSYDNRLEWDYYLADYYETNRRMSEKYVAVLKKQSNGKYKLVKINLKDTYGTKKVTKSKYKKLVKGKLSKKQLRNVIAAVMYECSFADNLPKKISKKKIRKAGSRKNRVRYLGVHATAFNGTKIKIKTANRILSSFTNFRYKRNRVYDEGYSSAKTNSKRVTINSPYGRCIDTKIRSVRYSSKKMVVLFTQRTEFRNAYYFNYKAILKKDKSKKFRLVRIEKTIPSK